MGLFQNRGGSIKTPIQTRHTGRLSRAPKTGPQCFWNPPLNPNPLNLRLYTLDDERAGMLGLQRGATTDLVQGVLEHMMREALFLSEFGV